MREDYDDQDYYEDDEDQEGSSKGGLLITVAAAAVSAAIAGGAVWYLSPDIKPYEQAIAQFEEELPTTRQPYNNLSTTKKVD